MTYAYFIIIPGDKLLSGQSESDITKLFACTTSAGTEILFHPSAGTGSDMMV